MAAIKKQGLYVDFLKHKRTEKAGRMNTVQCYVLIQLTVCPVINNYVYLMKNMLVGYKLTWPHDDCCSSGAYTEL